MSSPLWFRALSIIRSVADTTVVVGGTTLMLNRPLVSIDMKTLAMCTSTLPNTCLDTSKNQILTGRCGRSRQRL